MMSKKGPERSFLLYEERPLTAAAVTLMSFFCQWANWFCYEKLGYSWGFTLVTPLILCIMYHFVQLDAGVNGNFSRRFFFRFSVLVPLLIGILLTVIMLLSNPDISNFNPDTEFKGSVQETIATYAGRFVFTSVYMLIFALIDIPLLKIADGKRKDK